VTYITLMHHLGCEVCYFGEPSCFYEAIMYVCVFVVSLVFYLKTKKAIAGAIAGISFVGICFSTFLTYYVEHNSGCKSLDIYGVPLCVYGLTMYLLILALALIGLRSKEI
jgi:prolipoprotein diacylglyceryltransferase